MLPGIKMKTYRLIFNVILLLPAILFFHPDTSLAETLSAQGIMRKVEKRLRGNSSSGRVAMKIKNPNWERNIEIDFWLSGEENALLKIVSPPKEAGISSLRTGNTVWQYMPEVERTIKVPLSMMMQPWMGSDFTYDDMMKATTLVNDYIHAFAGEGGSDFWMIESIPKQGLPVVWGKLVFLVGKDYLPRKQDFYDERGRLVKTLEFSGFKQMGGRMFPSVWKMANENKKGSYTVLSYERIVFDSSIKPDIFSLRNLKK